MEPSPLNTASPKSARVSLDPETAEALETPVALAPGAGIPTYAYPGDAGADLCSVEAITLLPGERALVPTGVSVAIPRGYAGLILPRSGLALRHGIALVNAPGLIDGGYRGELKVLLLNTDRRESFKVTPGMRIAQLVLVPYARAHFTLVNDLPPSHRSEGGFGSSGS